MGARTDRILALWCRGFLTICALAFFWHARDWKTFIIAVAVALALDLWRWIYVEDVAPPQWDAAGNAICRPLPFSRFAPKTEGRAFLLACSLVFVPVFYACIATYCFHVYPDNAFIPPMRVEDDPIFAIAAALFRNLNAHRETLVQHHLATEPRTALILHVTAVSTLSTLVSITFLVTFGVRWMTGATVQNFSASSYAAYLERVRGTPIGLWGSLFFFGVMLFVIDFYPISLARTRRSYMPQDSDFDLLFHQFLLGMASILLATLYGMLVMRPIWRTHEPKLEAPAGWARRLFDRPVEALRRSYLTVCALIIFAPAPTGRAYLIALAIAVYLDLCRWFYIDNASPPRWNAGGENLKQPLPLSRFAPTTVGRSYLFWWCLMLAPFAYACVAVLCFHAFPDNGIVPPTRFRDDPAFRLAEPLFGILTKHRDTLLQHQLATMPRVTLILHVTAVSLLAALVSTILLVTIGVRWHVGLLMNEFSPATYKEYRANQPKWPAGILVFLIVLGVICFVIDFWPIDLVRKRKAYMPHVSNFNLLLYQFFLAITPLFFLQLYLAYDVRRLLRADQGDRAALSSPASEPMLKPTA